MKKILIILLAMLPWGFISCKHEIKEVDVRYELDGHGNFTSNGQSVAVVKEKGISQEELYAMVKNNVMKMYIHPDRVLTENEPTSMVVNGYSKNAFRNDLSGNISVSYRIMLEFDDGQIIITPNINKLYNRDFSDGSDDDFRGYVFWFLTDRTGTFTKAGEYEKQEIETFISAVVNALLWGAKSDE